MRRSLRIWSRRRCRPRTPPDLHLQGGRHRHWRTIPPGCAMSLTGSRSIEPARRAMPSFAPRLEFLDEIDGIALYSPRGAERVRNLLNAQPSSGYATFFCLSQACADRLATTNRHLLQITDRTQRTRTARHCPSDLAQVARGASVRLAHRRSADNPHFGNRGGALTVKGFPHPSGRGRIVRECWRLPPKYCRRV